MKFELLFLLKLILRKLLSFWSVNPVFSELIFFEWHQFLFLCVYRNLTKFIHQYSKEKQIWLERVWSLNANLKNRVSKNWSKFFTRVFIDYFYWFCYFLKFKHFFIVSFRYNDSLLEFESINYYFLLIFSINFKIFFEFPFKFDMFKKMKTKNEMKRKIFFNESLVNFLSLRDYSNKFSKGKTVLEGNHHIFLFFRRREKASTRFVNQVTSKILRNLSILQL